MPKLLLVSLTLLLFTGCAYKVQIKTYDANNDLVGKSIIQSNWTKVNVTYTDPLYGKVAIVETNNDAITKRMLDVGVKVGKGIKEAAEIVIEKSDLQIDP